MQSDKTNVSDEQFKDFLDKSHTKQFVQDWLDLARSDDVSVTVRNKTEQRNEDVKTVLKFNAFFVALNYLANSYEFVLNKTSQTTVEKRVSNFIEWLTEDNTNTSFMNYNPFECTNLSNLLELMDKNHQVHKISNLFETICIIHNNLFNNPRVEIEVFEECNSILDEFFTRFQNIK